MLPLRPGWGASIAEEEARACPLGERPLLLPLGGDRVERVPGFLVLLSTPDLSWSGVVSALGRLVLGQRVEGRGRRQREWPLTLLWEPVPQRKGLSGPSSRLDSHRPRLQNTPPVRGGAAFCLAPRFSAKKRRCLWLMDLLVDPVSSIRGGWAHGFGGQINGQPDKGV